MKKKIVRGTMYAVIIASSFIAYLDDAGLSGYFFWIVFLWTIIVAPVWAIANITAAGRMWLPGPDLAIFGAKPPKPSTALCPPSSEGQTAPPSPG